MITDLTYISYDEAEAGTQSMKHRHFEQCQWLVMDGQRTLDRRIKEMERAETLMTRSIDDEQQN